MSELIFDEHAEEYDAWFMHNRNVLASEVLLLKRAVGSPGKTLSVGSGTGLFEHFLRTQHGIAIDHGVEPSEPMAAIGRKRGMSVKNGIAENLPYEEGEFDTVVLNGSPSYITDLEKAFREAHRVLVPSGHIVVLDVPAESSYGLLYRLGAAIGSWEDPRLEGVAPSHPYPLALAANATWRTTPEKVELLRRAGFVEISSHQTLTRHPRYSDERVEEPIEGYDRGDYVALRGRKP